MPASMIPVGRPKNARSMIAARLPNSHSPRNTTIPATP